MPQAVRGRAFADAGGADGGGELAADRTFMRAMLAEWPVPSWAEPFPER